MTFPPYFANTTFSARFTSGIGASNNMLPINTLRHQHQQTRLFSTSMALNHTGQLSHMPASEPRSATPDPLPLPEDTRKDKIKPEKAFRQSGTNVSNEEEREMEDNAARMLLELSRIVAKEISTDSGCIAWGGTTRTKMEAKDLRASEGVTSNTNNVSPSPSPSLSVEIPKSIEIRNRDYLGFQNASASRSSLEDNPIPQLVTPNSSLSSQQLPPNTISQNSSFETFGASTERRGMNRFRTVSLAGDEMIPDDNEQLSPLLLPISPPLPPKDFTSSFHLPKIPLRSRFRRQRLFVDPKDLEQEAILRRALVGGGFGAKALSNLLVDPPSAMAAAAVITPIPEQPRNVLSFPDPFNKSSTIDPDSSNRNINGSAIQKTNKEQKTRLPIEPPPLLFQSETNQLEPPHKLPTVSGIGARSYAKPTKRLASLAAKAAVTNRKAKKKNQPVPGSRAKKAVPKKQQRQRHSGKKFSWKAFPELEEFLITNREEYLTYSAKNYTIEQRDYNNRLTSRLLEHAKASGYSTLFESCAFSAVRDRIRSYYKSYVQSFKRRRERQQQQERLKRLEMGCR